MLLDSTHHLIVRVSSSTSWLFAELWKFGLSHTEVVKLVSRAEQKMEQLMYSVTVQ